jgi:hypothetical protein
MNFRLKNLLLGGTAALVAGSLLAGCAKDKPAPVAAAPAPVEETRPGAAVERSLTVTATVQKINKKKRIVTLKFPDGRTAEVKCGPEVRNFPQIQVGDDVTAEFVESVEIFVLGPDGQPISNEAAEAVKRAPKGKKPAVAAVKAVETKATVEAIDYGTRQVTLKNPEGKLTTLTVGPSVKRLNEVKQGDTVVARLIEAISIEVTAPEKPAKKK